MHFDSNTKIRTVQQKAQSWDVMVSVFRDLWDSSLRNSRMISDSSGQRILHHTHMLSSSLVTTLKKQKNLPLFLKKTALKCSSMIEILDSDKRHEMRTSLEFHIVLLSQTRHLHKEVMNSKSVQKTLGFFLPFLHKLFS